MKEWFGGLGLSRALRIVILAAAVLFGAPTLATAHAILIEGSPQPGGSVEAPDVLISFKYNSRVDKRLSKLTLTNPDKSQTVLDIDPDSPTDILSAVVRLEPGAYSVRWQVLAVDGHITRGDVPFTVTPRAEGR